MMQNKNFFFPGQEIYSASPFMFCVIDEMREKFCNGCLNLTKTKMETCRTCKYAFYCTEQCQKQHWIIHKMECKPLKRVAPKYPTDWVRFLALVVLKLKNPKSWDIPDRIGSVERTFRHLDFGEYEDNSEAEFKLSQSFIALCQYIGLDMVAYEDFIPIYVKICRNYLYMPEDNSYSKALALYPGLSLFQHSCDANALRVFEGTEVRLRITKFIPSRSLLKVNVDLLDTPQRRQQRRDNLWKLGLPGCFCHRCQDNQFESAINKILDPEQAHNEENIYEFIEEAATNIEYYISEQTRDMEEANSIAEITLDEIQGVLGPMNVSFLKILPFAALSSFQIKKFEDSRNILLKMINIYQFYYGIFHPSVTNVMLKLTYVELQFKNKKRARQLFYQILRITAVARGTRSSEYCKLQKIEQVLSNENWDLEEWLLLNIWK